MMATLSLGDPIFSSYVFFSTILLIKMLLMSILTSTFRVGYKVFASPEDVAAFGGAQTRNDWIERIRSAHRNDMENIVPFLVLGLFYTLTNPSYFMAVLCFRVFTVARFLHTFFYLVTKSQPTRFFSHIAAMVVNVFMALQILF